MQMIIEKCVNIPIIYGSFINTFKNGAVKPIKTSAKIIEIITVKNTVTQTALSCQISTTKKMNMKIRKTFPTVFKIFRKSLFLDVRYWKVEGN